LQPTPKVTLRSSVVSELCRVCHEWPADSFEHVPPRKALNDQPTRVYGITDWLDAPNGVLTGGQIEQRGAGGFYLCQRCNNNTGSWYGKELVVAAASGARILRETSLDDLDAMLEPTWANVTFRQSETGPHPLRFIKQVVTMLLAISPIELSTKNPALGEFVMERERTGLPDEYRFYLSLFAGPNARTVGGAVKIDLERGRLDVVVEVAFPPFAYVMTIGSEPDVIPTAEITECANVGYNQRADMELGLLVGFGHVAFPIDYRTKAMVERDRAANEAYAREHGIEEGFVGRRPDDSESRGA
jgi:hypothetical protein